MPSLVPFRYVVLLVSALVACLFAFHIWTWDKVAYSCLNGKHFHTGPAKLEVWHIEIHPVYYDCPDAERYDPKLAKPTYEGPIAPGTIPDPGN